jgi:hypothetical protein
MGIGGSAKVKSAVRTVRAVRTKLDLRVKGEGRGASAMGTGGAMRSAKVTRIKIRSRCMRFHVFLKS